MALWVSDYLGDTSNLRAAQHGAYLLLMMHYWQHEGLPDCDEELSAIARMSADEWAKHKPVLQRFFHSGWKHKRIDAEIAEAKEKYSKRAAAGQRGGKQKASNATPADLAMLNQPQSQPHITAAATRARAELDLIESQIREATGLTDNPSPSLCNLAPILGLLDAGFSLDDEILPALRARGPTKRVTSWAYFVPIIHEYRQSRDAARNFQTAEVIHVGNRFRSQESGLAAAIRKAREFGRTSDSGDAPVSENAVADGG